MVWAAEGIGGIFVPDFTQSFRLEHSLVEGDEAEVRANHNLGKEMPKECRESRRLLGPQRHNWVFKFFKKTAMIRVASREMGVVEGNPGEDIGRGGRGGRGGCRKGPKR